MPRNLYNGSLHEEEISRGTHFLLKIAYDTWKFVILKDPNELGLKGRLAQFMAQFIKNFLEDWRFQVRIGTTLSELQKQELGIPQRSILSLTLLCVKINFIVKTLRPGMWCSLYVDDFLSMYRSHHMHTIVKQPQKCLNKIHKWYTGNGFTFPKQKLNAYILRKWYNDPG